MARVQGIQEKVHLPLYDSIRVEPQMQLAVNNPMRFFVDVQNKSRLETNLQSASLLPHYNTFEARAMRVVISDLPPQFPDDDHDTVEAKEADFDVPAVIAADGTTTTAATTATVNLSLADLVDLIHQAEESEEGMITIDADDERVTAIDDGATGEGREVELWLDELEALLDEFEDRAPAPEQVWTGNGSGNLISKLIFNTVTTLYVGEKIMIQMPTWFFPGGAGAFSESSTAVSHGEPTPVATFRFAEPVTIDRQQNFRVEIEVPDTDTLSELRRFYGPLYIWVVLDGFMTRDVQ
jgi:hypothetical protein